MLILSVLYLRGRNLIKLCELHKEFSYKLNILD